ncbi:hypothetical protein C8R44DRAFT_885176 [Mycena epipterygia]|nr:hypothetical protein C8R44DRAFT_885176 [Mycena epipterygia]
MKKSIQGDPEDSALPFSRLASGQQPSEKIRQLSNPVTIECLRTLRIEHWRQHSRGHPPQLDMFPEMHIDIVLEVLGHLHPLDLIHLSRSNQEFCALLRAPVTTTIWRESFVAPLPICPNSIPGRRWAHLIFGAPLCEGCGAPGTSSDCYIHRRLCSECISPSTTLPGYPLSHVIYTLIGRTGWKIYLPDALPVTEEYERLLADDGPTAAVTLANFMEKRKQVLQQNKNAFMEYNEWLIEKKVLPMVRKRLLEEGCDPRDIKTYIEEHRFDDCFTVLEGIPRLSSKREHTLSPVRIARSHRPFASLTQSHIGCNKVRPGIVARVNFWRIYRLKRERSERKHVVRTGIILAIEKNCAPSTWAYTPALDNIIGWPQFAELVDSTMNVSLADDDSCLLAALERLPADLDAWTLTQQTHLALQIPGARRLPDLRTLDLATTVFAHGDTRCLVGWLDAGLRLASDPITPPSFCATSSAVARALVLLVDLGPGTATAADMDEQNERFCAVCVLRLAAGERQCPGAHLQHAMEHPADPPMPTSWARLSPEGAADVRRREGADRSSTENVWICNMCPVHFDLYRPIWRAEAISHVASEHAVLRPVENVHFIYDLRKPRSLRHPPVFLSEAPDALEYRCNYCAEEAPEIVKLLALYSVARHVKAK